MVDDEDTPEEDNEDDSVVARADAVLAGAIVVEILAVDAASPQPPYAAWQPVPQYEVVLPQNPVFEQQFPKILPRHTVPFVPQLPSTLIRLLFT